MEELKSCPFCGKPLYIKIKRYTKPLLAPLTPAAALRDELIDITGEDYVPIKAEYCPVCGKPLNRRAVTENPRRKSGTESAENGSASAPDGGGNRPLTCEGCRFEPLEGSSWDHCLYCTRRWPDKYARRPERSESNG